jgi:ubiquinone/menaquinone biosynthesis C-methylase UbiE
MWSTGSRSFTRDKAPAKAPAECDEPRKRMASVRPAGSLPQDSMSAEEARIGEAYARRAAATPQSSWFDPGHVFMVQEVERRMLAALTRHGVAPLHSKRILEIGCGHGHWLRELIKWGARPTNVTGVDLLADRLTQARRMNVAGVKLIRANAARLEFADGSFDIVLQATAFTSMLDAALKQRVAAEMLRVLSPGGIILWYDFRFDNPRNPDVRGVNKRESEKLFPGCRIALRRTTLLPPLLRVLARYSWLACHALSALPWACTHYFGTIRKAHP